MKLKHTLYGILLATGLVACGEGSPELTPEMQAVKNAQENHIGKPEDLLRRMETYARFGQATDIFTYPRKDDGQFATIVVDSAGRRMNLFFDVGTGYDFVMERLSSKGRPSAPYNLKGIRLVKNECAGSGVPDLHSFEVEIAHSSSSAPKKPTRQNDTPTNIAELNWYRQYGGGPFTPGTSLCKSGEEYIPSFVEVQTPKSFSMVRTEMGSNVIDFNRQTARYEIVAVQREIRKLVGSGSTKYRGYIVYMAQPQPAASRAPAPAPAKP